MELANLIKGLLQVAPTFRPSCEKILDMKIVKNRMGLLLDHHDPM